MTDLEERFLNYIKQFSKDNPTFSPEIERELEISGVEVRVLRKNLQQMGYPIVSGYGYWYDETDPDPVLGLKLRALDELETYKLFHQNKSKALNNNPQLEMAL